METHVGLLKRITTPPLHLLGRIWTNWMWKLLAVLLVRKDLGLDIKPGSASAGKGSWDQMDIKPPALLLLGKDLGQDVNPWIC